MRMRNSPRTFCPRKSGPRGVRRPESLRKMIGRDFMDFGAGFFIEWEFAKPPGLTGRNKETSFHSGAPATEPLHPARGGAGGHWCALTGSDDVSSILSCPVMAHLTVGLQSSPSAKQTAECEVRSAELKKRSSRRQGACSELVEGACAELVEGLSLPAPARDSAPTDVGD
jgi:hypothetical protein